MVCIVEKCQRGKGSCLNWLIHLENTHGCHAREDQHPLWHVTVLSERCPCLTSLWMPPKQRLLGQHCVLVWAFSNLGILLSLKVGKVGPLRNCDPNESSMHSSSHLLCLLSRDSIQQKQPHEVADLLLLASLANFVAAILQGQHGILWSSCSESEACSIMQPCRVANS